MSHIQNPRCSPPRTNSLSLHPSIMPYRYKYTPYSNHDVTYHYSLLNKYIYTSNTSDVRVTLNIYYMKTTNGHTNTNTMDDVSVIHSLHLPPCDVDYLWRIREWSEAWLLQSYFSSLLLLNINITNESHTFILFYDWNLYVLIVKLYSIAISITTVVRPCLSSMLRGNGYKRSWILSM